MWILFYITGRNRAAGNLTRKKKRKRERDYLGLCAFVQYTYAYNPRYNLIVFSLSLALTKSVDIALSRLRSIQQFFSLLFEEKKKPFAAFFGFFSEVWWVFFPTEDYPSIISFFLYVPFVWISSSIQSNKKTKMLRRNRCTRVKRQSSESFVWYYISQSVKREDEKNPRINIGRGEIANNTQGGILVSSKDNIVKNKPEAISREKCFHICAHIHTHRGEIFSMGFELLLLHFFYVFSFHQPRMVVLFFMRIYERYLFVDFTHVIYLWYRAFFNGIFIFSLDKNVSWLYVWFSIELKLWFCIREQI